MRRLRLKGLSSPLSLLPDSIVMGQMNVGVAAEAKAVLVFSKLLCGKRDLLQCCATNLWSSNVTHGRLLQEKRKRDAGQATSSKNYVEEEKRLARQHGVYSGFDT